MRCRTCLLALRGPFRETQKHHIERGQCAYCHYFGMRGKTARTYKGHIVRGATFLTDRKHHTIFRPITKENVGLYCKVKQILGGKECNKKMILSNHKNIMYSTLYNTIEKEGSP